MSSNSIPRTLSETLRTQLLGIARDSIEHGLDHRRALDPTLDALPPELKAVRATFVTLDLEGNLRGCIGSLKASLPLAEDVAQNAFQAAFHDPRFAPVNREEFDPLEIHISVLSPSEKMTFSSESDFLGQLRPGIDGIILRDGYNAGTFLPAVWEDLPKPRDFLLHLKMKAGLPPGYWSDTVQAWRYTTEYFP